jgi:hypothetical protein
MNGVNTMKINWRVLIAAVVVVGAIVLAVSSVSSRSYSGSNLNFIVGRGPVTVTNPSDQPVAVQLLGKGSRTFSVTSTIGNVAGSSTREGTGSNSPQVFGVELPPGVSEFTVVRGTTTTPDVNFVADTDTRLAVVAQPLNANDARTTIIVAAVVILGALFYMSRATGHLWINTLRGKTAPAQASKPLVQSATSSQGSPIRAFGDNRVDISE